MMGFEPDINLLTAAMDRVVPQVDDLPGAGGMGLAQEVIDRSKEDPRFWAALVTVLEVLPSAEDFATFDGDDQDKALTSVESNDRRQFGLWLDVVYTVYYMQPQVHQRLGWHGRPPQPDGNEMPPWDESILKNVRKREPFWRQV